MHVEKSINALISIAAVFVIITGLKLASSFVVPFLIAIVLGVIASTPLQFLTRHRVNNMISVLLVITFMASIIFAFGYFIIGTFESMSLEFNHYKELFTLRSEDVLARLQAYGIVIDQDFIKIDTLKAFLTDTLKSAGGLLSNTLMILFLLFFMLLESKHFSQKIANIWEKSSPTMVGLNSVIKSINRYLVIKTATSLLTGVLVALFAWVMGIEFALFLGVIAFLLNFIPTIGSIIAAVPALILAWLSLPLDIVVYTALGYVVINIGVSNFIEPKFMGDGLGLSILVVFVSLIFWGWIFGITGMLFSAILTMIVKIALEAKDDTRWMARLLGNK